jgi:hypothetical protein
VQIYLIDIIWNELHAFFNPSTDQNINCADAFHCLRYIPVSADAVDATLAYIICLLYILLAIIFLDFVKGQFMSDFLCNAVFAWMRRDEESKRASVAG